MLEGKEVYVHLVPHGHMTSLIHRDPFFSILFGKKLVPKVDLLILESAPDVELDYKSNLSFLYDLRKFYFEIRSRNIPLKDLDSLDYEIKRKGLTEYEKLDIKYFLSSMAKNVVFESEFYDEKTYEKIREGIRDEQNLADDITYNINHGRYKKAKEADLAFRYKISEQVKLRDKEFIEKIRERISKYDADSILVNFGHAHKNLSKYLDADGKNTLLFISDTMTHLVTESYIEHNKKFNERYFLTALIGSLIEDPYDIGNSELAFDVVRSFDDDEFEKIENEFERNLEVSSKLSGTVDYFELTWHLDEILRPRLEEKGLSRLIPKWKFL